ncbi:ribosome biogenesis BRX1-like [Micractinium conductrix]|uniref:Ribosome biogenesis BRX1-like n=1 Tax=Micractinium conductrix TaxID=554055 RepID=A0A2P6VMA8_9CHLO|nr:ribosome biogenesis BRX1-like [Micractinium conductrix]|eukprot:PSC75219.1 ribosome biogenesis BRX1-like [Micractinium conductrix]
MAKRKAPPAEAAPAPAKAARKEAGGKRRAPQDDEGPSTSGGGAVAAAHTVSGFKNKEKVLLLSSRGITYRFRHLMLDLGQLLPHGKKDAKLDTKSERGVINEVADMKGCTSVLYFEARKHKDLYLWVAKAPQGPSVKFHVTNVHTLEELKLSGNHLRGSRPVLSFDKNFDESPHLQLLKEMLTQVFAVPKRHHKSKPFFDHVTAFSVTDGRIWLRNYQVLPDPDKKRAAAGEGLTLVEVGPRACLQPIKMFAGSFGGPVIYENQEYVSPNTIRSMIKRQQQGKYVSKVQSRQDRKLHVAAHPLPRDELGDVFK